MGALVKVSGGAVVGADRSLSPAIQRGITDITIAFQAGVPRSNSDRVRSLQLYAEAISIIHPAIAEHTLRWITLHNPRNPFPPTPQDVFEACKATERNWRGAILKCFGLLVGGRCGLSRYGSSSTPKPEGAPFDGPPPLTAGCLAPPDLVIDLLRGPLRLGFDDELRRLSDAEFAALPDGALAPEHRERLLAERARDVTERKEQEART